MNSDGTESQGFRGVQHSPPSTLRSGRIRVNTEDTERPETSVNDKEMNSSQDNKIKALEEKIEALLKVFKNGTVPKFRCESQESLESDNTSVTEPRPNVLQRQGIRLPRGGWIKSPFDEVKFTGKSEDMKPMRFLKKFNTIASYEDVDDADLLYFFGRSMRDQAAVWYELQDFSHINEAREKFTQHFWGENQQAKFREKLYMGKYKPNKAIRISDYALDLARKAKFLEPPMSDTEIIRCLKRHFDREISKEIKLATVRNIAELTSLLEEIQDEKDVYAETRTKEKIPSKSNVNARKTQEVDIKENKTKWNAKKSFKYPSKERKALPWYTNAREYRENKNPKPIVEFPSSESEEDRDNTVHKSKTEAKAMSAGAKKTAKEGKTAGKKGISAIARRTQQSSSDEDTEITEPDINCEAKNLRKNPGETRYEEKSVSIMRTKKIMQDLEEENSETNDEQKANPIINVLVGETEIRTLIDTGAEVSVMSRNTLNQLIHAEESYDKIPIRKCKLRGAFGEQELTIPCKIQILMKINKHKLLHEFYVVDKLAYPMVIGHDVLAKYKALIEYNDSQFSVQFQNDTTPEIKILSLAKSDIEGGVKLREILQKHAEVFQEEIGRVNHYRHRIEMMDEKPFKRKPYPIPEIHREKVRELINEWEKQGIIKKAATQFINPLVTVVKKSGDLRICLDAREITHLTK